MNEFTEGWYCPHCDTLLVAEEVERSFDGAIHSKLHGGCENYIEWIEYSDLPSETLSPQERNPGFKSW